MRAHVVENGVVVNTIEVENLSDFPNLVEATEGSIGWNYDGTNFTNPNALTQAELDAQHEEAMRTRRNNLLAETDWWANSDVTMTTAQRNYRQALRDITTHANWPFLNDGDWPTKP